MRFSISDHYNIISNPALYLLPFPRYATTYVLKLFIENCDQTAADGNMVTIDNL